MTAEETWATGLLASVAGKMVNISTAAEARVVNRMVSNMVVLFVLLRYAPAVMASGGVTNIVVVIVLSAGFYAFVASPATDCASGTLAFAHLLADTRRGLKHSAT